MLASLGLMLVYLQQQFDKGDYNRAIEMVSSREPGAQWSVLQEMVSRAGSGSPNCEPKLISSFQGTLEVSCLADGALPYRFAVDLVRKSVTPMDERTRELVAAAKQKALTAQDAGVDGSPVDAGSP
jgi:hypothetical protein